MADRRAAGVGAIAQVPGKGWVGASGYGGGQLSRRTKQVGAVVAGRQPGDRGVDHNRMSRTG